MHQWAKNYTKIAVSYNKPLTYVFTSHIWGNVILHDSYILIQTVQKKKVNLLVKLK
jgi:hypothetical protein